MDEPKRSKFLWGVLLAWIPALPFVFILIRILRNMSSHATGLAAVVGGLAEIYLPLGLFLTVVFEIVAIVLLFSGFSRGQSTRSAIAAVSICCSLLTICFFGVFLWAFFKNLHGY